jgi:hypothetical protein
MNGLFNMKINIFDPLNKMVKQTVYIAEYNV